MSLRLPVDHVGILGASASRMAECWRRLGFHVVGPADLKSGARGDEQELGQRSAHIMFPGDYIELTSVNPPRPDHHLARFFDRPLGIRLMILASRDIGSDHHRCQQAGLEPGDVQDASRAVEGSGTARFRWFALPATRFSDTLVCYVQHLTPDLVFDDDMAQHPIGAVGLSRLVYKAPSLPAVYQRLPGGNGGLIVEAEAEDDAHRRYRVAQDADTGFAVVGIRISSRKRAGDLLRSAGIPHWSNDGCIGVDPSHTGGIGLLLESP
ncbi:MAG: VOC family protein [Xanthomonadales bacterium]|nr:VOC family protein [Xanthomonadales bacterium]